MPAPVRFPTVTLVAHDIHDQGGMERAFGEIIRRLGEECRFIVVSATLDVGLRDIVDWRRVPTPKRPFTLKYVWFFVVGGLRVRRTKSDLVHVLGAIVPNRADVACIQFCHAGFVKTVGKLATPEAPFFHRLNSLVTRWFGLRAEEWCYRPQRLRAFGAVSAGVARELKRHFPRTPVALTPNGVDVFRYCPHVDHRIRLRSEEAVGDDEVVALFVGGDWGRKGLKYAIEAVGLARQSGWPGYLWIVGRGDRRHFENIAKEAAVSDRLRFFGPQAATEKFFQAADVVVLPTQYETFSLVAYEAAASGVPVLATAVSGVEDLLRGNVAGILVDRNAEDISEKLLMLWRDKRLRMNLGESGRRRAHEYTWEKAADSVRDLYASLLVPR